MTNTDLYSRYIWLIELIYRCDGISRQEINNQWAKSALNVLGEDEIPERTFHRHKIAIKQLFGIDIYCDRSTGSCYRIRNVDKVMDDPEMYWFLHSCVISSFLRQYKHLSHRILLERVIGGREYLITITEAMRDERTLLIEYPNVATDSYESYEVEPYFLKLNLRRWYLFGLNRATNKVETFTLARIKKISATENTFVLPNDFNPSNYFPGGVESELGDINEVLHITLRLDHGQQSLLRAQPLHHTQREISSDEHSATFAMDVDLTVEFVQQLLRFGSALEVIEPPILRKYIARIATKILQRHID